jgi:hypothetical protein
MSPLRVGNPSPNPLSRGAGWVRGVASPSKPADSKLGAKQFATLTKEDAGLLQDSCVYCLCYSSNPMAQNNIHLGRMRIE